MSLEKQRGLFGRENRLHVGKRRFGRIDVSLQARSRTGRCAHRAFADMLPCITRHRRRRRFGRTFRFDLLHIASSNRRGADLALAQVQRWC